MIQSRLTSRRDEPTSDRARRRSEALSATAEPRSLHDKLRSCLELKDMAKQRLDCDDAILPPKPQPKYAALTSQGR